MNIQSNQEQNLKFSYEDYRLPVHVVPQQYFLDLEDTFNGSVTIELTVVQESDNITLHIKNLTVDNLSISLTSETQQPAVEKIMETEDDREFYIIYFNESLLAGVNYNMSMSFEGTLNLENEGFYLAKYKDSEGTER